MSLRTILAEEGLLRGAEYLKSFLRIQRQVGELAAAGKAEEILDKALELARILHPVAEALTQVSVQRADEQRKLNSLLDKLSPLRLFTAEHIKSVLTKNPEIRVPIAIANLEEGVRFLARNFARLEGYLSLERQFVHGPFLVVNEYGYQPGEYSVPLGFLDETASGLRTAGYGHLLYGQVNLVGAESRVRGAAGLYAPDVDQIFLNVDARRRDTVYVLTHEFGHRLWFKFLTPEARESYSDKYNGTAPHLTVTDREAIFEALVQADFSVARLRRYLPAELASRAVRYLKERLGAETQQSLRGSHARNPSDLRFRVVLPGKRFTFLEGARPQSITDYGRTNEKEDFAEVFAHVVTGKLLAGNAYDRFVAAVG